MSIPFRKSGLIIYNLFPLLVGTTRDWKTHLARIRQMDFDVVYVNPFHLAGESGSIYSIKDTFNLDPRFKDSPSDGDRAIQEFDEDARRCGLRVMIDLVVNHAARDSLLLETNPEFFAREPNGGLVTPWAVDISSETGKVFWHDLANFNYTDPAISARLIEHCDNYVARFQRLGITAFRCDAAHMVPSEVWLQLIQHAKTRDPQCLFVAETLGCTLERTAEVASLGFDYIMNNFAYSDFENLRALVEYEELHTLAPSIAFPESHDTDRVAARLNKDDVEGVSRALLSRYMLAAFFSTGVMMPLGYEWGYRKKIDVVKSSPRDFEQTNVDISRQIAEINRVRRSLAPLNVEGVQKRLSKPGDPVLLLLRGDEFDLQHSCIVTLVVANTSEKRVSISRTELLETTKPFIDFADYTPGVEAFLFETLELKPGEVRILCGANSMRHIAEIASSCDPIQMITE
jgi:starch synthase (maltosyl-transferring)